MQAPKVILFINSNTHHLFGQQHLITAYIAKGYKILLLTPDDGNYFYKLQSIGYNCIPLSINSKGMNPFADIKFIFYLRRVFTEHQPSIICSFTIKCNLYSVIAARALGIPVIVNITGLGYIFMKDSVLSKIILGLYRYSFRSVAHVIFQNPTDQKLFLSKKIIHNPQITTLVPGSGVNLNKFPFVGYTNNSDAVTFLYSGRLLWDKGIGELIEAFRVVKLKYPEVKLKFIGNYFLANPAAIKPEEFESWQRELDVEYLGMVDNVSEVIASIDCVVLPSYREGMP